MALEAEGEHSPIGVSRAVDRPLRGSAIRQQDAPRSSRWVWIASHLEQQMDGTAPVGTVGWATHGGNMLL